MKSIVKSIIAKILTEVASDLGIRISDLSFSFSDYEGTVSQDGVNLCDFCIEKESDKYQFYLEKNYYL